MKSSRDCLKSGYCLKARFKKEAIEARKVTYGLCPREIKTFAALGNFARRDEDHVRTQLNMETFAPSYPSTSPLDLMHLLAFTRGLEVLGAAEPWESPGLSQISLVLFFSFILSPGSRKQELLKAR